MQDLLDNIIKLESNVNALLQKLEKLSANNAILVNENNRLREELQKVNVMNSPNGENSNERNPSSDIDKSQTLKAEIQSCIDEVVECMTLIEKQNMT